jgi:hypothetical protein
MKKSTLKEMITECVNEVLIEGVDMQSLMDLQKLLNNPPVKWAQKNYPGGIEAYKKMLRMKIERVKKQNKQLDESTPPGFPAGLKKKLLRKYSSKPTKAYQTMWALHNKHGEKLEEMWGGW